jgi:hypothetical protein
MRALLIDDTAQAEIKRVKEFALARRQSIQDILAKMRGDQPPSGNDASYSLEIYDGWRVVYTVEQHPSGWYYHISVSVSPTERGKQWPHPAGVNLILKEFGLGSLTDCNHAWEEDTGDRKAINLLFPFKEPA